MSLFSRFKNRFQKETSLKDVSTGAQKPTLALKSAGPMVGRRGFLKGLVATGTVVAAPSLLKAVETSETEDKKQFLWDVYFESLKLNEGEKLQFYRCSADKVTVGYGLNAEANPGVFKTLNMTVNHKGKPLTEAERETFLKTLSGLSKEKLEAYSISKEDAVRSATYFGKNLINRIVSDFGKDTTRGKKIDFLKMPVFAQCIVLDLYYNLGSLRRFPKFETAVRNGDFKTMMAECRVKTSGKGQPPKYNESREVRKQRWNQIARWLYQTYTSERPLPSRVGFLGIVSAYHQAFHPKPAEALAEMNILLGEVCRYCRRPDLFKVYQHDSWMALNKCMKQPSLYQIAQISQNKLAKG